MRDVKNIAEVSQLHPDYMGFIFYTGSPRYVGDDFRVPEDFPASIKRVGVFVNESNGTILKKIKELDLDMVQLHGDESPQQCRELKSHYTGVIKVFSVDDDMDFEVTAPYRDAVDFFLFDTKGKYYGGNARAFDWRVLGRYDQAIPFFLSGGISPDNIDAIQNFRQLNLQGIDVNSGVEIEPALKDVKKIMAIKEKINSKS